MQHDNNSNSLEHSLAVHQLNYLLYTDKTDDIRHDISTVITVNGQSVGTVTYVDNTIEIAVFPGYAIAAFNCVGVILVRGSVRLVDYNLTSEEAYIKFLVIKEDKVLGEFTARVHKLKLDLVQH